ncbi:MAG TPA: ABC transporter substrate-binding protein [Hydrogenophaga sp.]|nr:ABC transporter substrate-binding protein [Hydrogenophaga sp.]
MLAATAPAQAQSQSSWCASGKPVKFAGITWESGQLLTALMRHVMEHGYGCKTEEIPGNSVTMEVALSTNDVQVFAEEWIGRSEAWNKAAAAGKVKAVGNVIVGATEGWYVPEYVVKGDAKRNIKPSAPDLKSINDLVRYKQVFKDDEEPGKGRFLNCPAGWTCEGINTQKLKAYKLGDSYVNFRPGTGAALDAAIASAVQRGKPVLFYYWTPTGLMGKYKFVQLEEGAYDEACYKTLTNKDHATPCGSGSPDVTIQAGVSSVFHDADPVLVDMLSKFNVPIDLLNQSLSGMADRKMDAKKTAIAFLKSHPDVWTKWVPADVAGKVTASLK